MSAFFIGIGIAVMTAIMIAIAGRSFRHIAIGAVAMFCIGGAVAYLAMPTLNFWFSDGFWFVLIMMIIATAIAAVGPNENREAPRWLNLAAFDLTVALLFFVLWMVSTSAMFRMEDYAALIGTVQERKLAEDLAPVDVHNIRQVPSAASAVKVARIMGSDPGLGSSVEVGTKSPFIENGCFRAQLLGGEIKDLCFTRELVEMAPLEHSGFGKWLSNGTTPGYTLASTVHPDKFYIVTGLVSKKDGTATTAPATGTSKMGETASAALAADEKVEPIKLRYLDSAYFSDNLTRYIYQHGYATRGFTEPSFELDDHGRPFVVVTLYDHTIGYGGANVTGALVLDPQTGDMTEYALKDVPEWIERVQPADFVVDQLNDWGGYSNGRWAAWYSYTGVQKTTDGHALVEGADGHLYTYTGMTSVGNDNGTSGFMLVNTRTKEARQYLIAGGTEDTAAKSAASGPHVKTNHYNPTFPVMYNVDGLPTYFTTLMDDHDNVRAFAFVDVQRTDLVGTGDSWQDALRDYRQVLIQNNVPVNTSDVVTSSTFDAKVLDVTSEVNAGVQTYYLLLEGKDGKEFSAPLGRSIQLKWTHVGDTVKVTADIGDNPTVPISAFINTSKPQLPKDLPKGQE